MSFVLKMESSAGLKIGLLLGKGGNTSDVVGYTQRGLLPTRRCGSYLQAPVPG